MLIGTAFALCNFFDARTQVGVFHFPLEIVICWFLSVGDRFCRLGTQPTKKIDKKIEIFFVFFLFFIAVSKNVFSSEMQRFFFYFGPWCPLGRAH